MQKMKNILFLVLKAYVPQADRRAERLTKGSTEKQNRFYRTAFGRQSKTDTRTFQGFEPATTIKIN